MSSQLDDYAQQLSAIEGVTVKSRTDLNDDKRAIDFAIDWTGETQPAEKHPLRYNAVENSAIIVNAIGDARTVQLRLPPIPQEPNEEEEARQTLEQRFQRTVGAQVTVRLASDGSTWTPHVRLGGSVWRQPMEDTISAIESVWSTYRNIALPDGDI